MVPSETAVLVWSLPRFCTVKTSNLYFPSAFRYSVFLIADRLLPVDIVSQGKSIKSFILIFISVICVGSTISSLPCLHLLKIFFFLKTMFTWLVFGIFLTYGSWCECAGAASCQRTREILRQRTGSMTSFPVVSQHWSGWILVPSRLSENKCEGVRGRKTTWVWGGL